MSKNIVLAGPGALGKHFINALLESGAFNLTVFSRSAKPELEKKGAVVKIVDYSSSSSLLTTFQSISPPPDTVLSTTVSLTSPSKEFTSQKNLLDASLSIPTIRRFIPAEYANDIQRFPNPPTLEKQKLDFREYLREQIHSHNSKHGNNSGEPAAENHKIEYTLFCVGIFLDFFIPAPHKKYFPNFPPLIIDFNPPPPPPPSSSTPNTDTDPDAAAQPWVKIPGDEPDARISFTLVDDLAKAMVHLLLSSSPIGSSASSSHAGGGEFTYFSSTRASFPEIADIYTAITSRPVKKIYVSSAQCTADIHTAKAKMQKASGAAIEMEAAAMELYIAELIELFGNGSESLPENSPIFAGMDKNKGERMDWETLIKQYYT